MVNRRELVETDTTQTILFRSKSSFIMTASEEPPSNSATVSSPGSRPPAPHRVTRPSSCELWPVIRALYHFLSGTENRSALVTPTLLLTLLPRGRPLTYPVCESAPRCSQALKETDRNDVTCSVNKMECPKGWETPAKMKTAWLEPCSMGAHSPMEPERTRRSEPST